MLKRISCSQRPPFLKWRHPERKWMENYWTHRFFFFFHASRHLRDLAVDSDILGQVGELLAVVYRQWLGRVKSPRSERHFAHGGQRADLASTPPQNSAFSQALSALGWPLRTYRCRASIPLRDGASREASRPRRTSHGPRVRSGFSRWRGEFRRHLHRARPKLIMSNTGSVVIIKRDLCIIGYLRKLHPETDISITHWTK